MTDQKAIAVLLFGPPGVGKGTQGRLLGAIPGFQHMSTGEMFRDMGASALGKKIRNFTEKGQLVPDDLTIQIWRAVLEDDIGSKRFKPAEDLLILDGIPRTPAQVGLITQDTQVLKVIHMKCTDQEQMVERIRARAARENRLDDAREEIIRERFRVYDEESRPVLECYSSDLIVEVNANATPAEVLREMLDHLIPVQKAHLAAADD